MKIRAIGLHNVRRFAGQSARIEGIGDGINTICEPNESGKSTFFDALHAVFFIDYKSVKVKSLQPYSGGSVQVSVDVEIDDGLFRIEKRFMSSKSASVTDLEANRIIAQEGEAEAWIARLLGADGPGPSGLLWVRQGMSGFGPDGSGKTEKDERERLREARRTLMSTVAGQIDAVTSGRKMDAIMRRCEAEIYKLANKNGSAKASGPWHAAAKEVEVLGEEHDRLKTQVDELSAALETRRRLKADLERRSDPESDVRRDAEVRAAEEAVTAALEHAKLIETAERELRLARMEAESAARARNSRVRELARRKALAEASDAKALAAAEASTKAEGTARALETKTQDLRVARDAAKAARAALRVARVRARRADMIRRKEEIEALLEKISRHEDALSAARRAIAGIAIDADSLDGLEDLERRRNTAQAARAAGAARFRLDYDGDALARGPGGDVPGGAWLPVVEAMELALPGIGRLALAPAADQSDVEDPAEIEHQLADALADLGLDDLAAARQAVRTRHDADAVAMQAKNAISALAPNGVEALREELELIGEQIDALGSREEADTAEDLDLPTLEQAALDAEEAEADAVTDQEKAARANEEAARASTTLETEARLAREALEAALSEPLETVDEEREAENIAALEAQADGKQEDLDGLRSSAPDLEALEAERDRIVSARRAALDERRRISDEIRELNGLIGARGEDNVEARLATTADALALAEEREQRYAMEVAALKMLLGELDGARKAARDAYFGPVYEQLTPLLAMLHEGAEIEMNGETMLPARIVRNGVAEDIENLSGGASEQVAILTRLAFARLYAKSGRSVPVILDDALVYSDDERIVRMFTALTRIARDQQIIVFSCRQRAFEELGGHRPRISTAAAAG